MSPSEETGPGPEIQGYNCEHVWDLPGPTGITYDADYGRGSVQVVGCSKCGLWRTTYHNGKRHGEVTYATNKA